MKNKITFFRFLASSHLHNEKRSKNEFQIINEIKYLKSHLAKNPIKSEKELDKKEIKLLNTFYNIGKELGFFNPKKASLVNNYRLALLLIQKPRTNYEKLINKKINAEFNVSKLVRLIRQKDFNVSKDFDGGITDYDEYYDKDFSKEDWRIAQNTITDKYLISHLENNPIKEYYQLNTDDEIYLNSFFNFGEKLGLFIDKYSHITNKYDVALNCILDPITDSERLFNKKINNKFDAKDILRLIYQEDYNDCQSFIKANNEQLELEKIIVNDRIDIHDLNNLDKVINEMNEKGWRIKQIEGIQSGKYEMDYGTHEFGGSGYGYGFTEGIMIVWEK